MKRAAALEKLSAILRACPDLNAHTADVHEASDFAQDLCFDSLMLISLLFELHQEFPHLNEADAASWKTVGDCLDSMLAAQKVPA